MTTPVQVLRWLCVLPGALLAALLVAFPVHWVVMLIQVFGRSDDAMITVDGKTPLAAIPPEVLERLGQAFFASFAIVGAGTWIAPRHKFRTGIALAVTAVFALILAHTFIALRGYQITGGWLQRTLTCLLQIAGLSWGLYHAHRADKHRTDVLQ